MRCTAPSQALQGCPSCLCRLRHRWHQNGRLSSSSKRSTWIRRPHNQQYLVRSTVPLGACLEFPVARLVVAERLPVACVSGPVERDAVGEGVTSHFMVFQLPSAGAPVVRAEGFH